VSTVSALALARMAHEAGDAARARTLFARAAGDANQAMKWDRARGLGWLGLALEGQDKPIQAVQAFRASLALHPPYPFRRNIERRLAELARSTPTRGSVARSPNLHGPNERGAAPSLKWPRSCLGS